ncbi:hypothetical protein Taro_014650 [Colocasia esculenta]|uniref:CCHC-type domain-containing protein n=1 Tax=Colocasia esculenta TaxID=4460 RepID=A0A843UMG1_COLES|nr:hypothetical protein [Colocasia esculenta]
MIVCYECKKPGHMRGECPKLKKKLKKDKFTFKKAKAMMATWSDEDEEDNAQGSSRDEEIQCLMARSEDCNKNRNLQASLCSSPLPPLVFLLSRVHSHSDLSTPMAPRKNLCATCERHASPEADEGFRAPAEHRSKHRDDRLPELLVPQGLHLTRVWGTFQCIVQPRYVNFSP